MRKHGLYIAFLALFVGSCLEIETYPVVPEIHFDSYKVYEYIDTGFLNNLYVRCELHFTIIDGDGNVGSYHKEYGSYRDMDTLYPNIHRRDLYMTRYLKTDGEYFLDTAVADTLDRFIPFIEKEGQNKTLIGELVVNKDFLKALLDFDTIRYEYFIVDRDENISNVDTTPDLVLIPQPFQ